ncbi:MAG: hypothetical protein KAV82_13615 [Phycisphaerae bacterium]|nr:hypothetical protein [Phycisphaerae bacterium]
MTQFFQTEDLQTRHRLLDAILKHPEANLTRVAEAVRRVQVWKPAPPGVEVFDVKFGDGLQTSVAARVPESYDPNHRYPLILALHDRGQGSLGCVQYLEQVLGNEVENFIIAAPQNYKGIGFLVTQAESTEPVAILDTLRRRYHLDTDRIYAIGCSVGGDAAFMAAVLYTDWFASAVAVAGTFITPMTPGANHMLLSNARGFPMLVVWGEHDTRNLPATENHNSGGIASRNRALQAELPEMGVNQMEFVEIEGKGHPEAVPPRDRLLHFLQLRRGHNQKHVSHWFRFPAQGWRGWLRQRQFDGEPWVGQLVVRVQPGTNIREYAQEVVQSKLGLIEGSIEGQTIRLRLRRCRRTELLLHGGLIDLTRPITVYRGKKIVFKGRVQPKVSTLLKLAYRDWEFQRLPCVRMVVPDRGKAWQEN